MYLLFGIFFLILLFFFCVNHWRKKKIIKKICSMCCDEKCSIMNEIIEPFGFSYLVSQDIFTSRTDAWQRELGYCTLFDDTAYHFHLVFDSLPIFFDYRGRTWRVELWKGQYGINTGGELGIYYADRILHEKEYKNTLFHSVSNEDMPRLSFNLFRRGARIADVCENHWWLTAFSMGRFTNPADLCMQASITFPNREMSCAFVQGLLNAGYCEKDICACRNTVTFCFSCSTQHHGFFRRLRVAFAQWSNRFWCRIYLFVTRPFCLSLDRLLYLYYYLPRIFRRTLRIRRYKKYKPKRRYS